MACRALRRCDSRVNPISTGANTAATSNTNQRQGGPGTSVTVCGKRTLTSTTGRVAERTGRGRIIKVSSPWARACSSGQSNSWVAGCACSAGSCCTCSTTPVAFEARCCWGVWVETDWASTGCSSQDHSIPLARTKAICSEPSCTISTISMACHASIAHSIQVLVDWASACSSHRHSASFACYTVSCCRALTSLALAVAGSAGSGRNELEIVSGWA